MVQGLVLAIGGVLTGVLNGLTDGSFEWRTRWFTRRLLSLATKHLPETQQKRFVEEWTSHMNDVQGDVRKVLFAWGCVVAAHEMVASLTADKGTSYGRFTNRARDLLRASKRLFLTMKNPSLRELPLITSLSELPQSKGMHVKVGPTRPDGKLHPHAGKTGRITRFINIYSDPYWLGRRSAMVELDFPMERFIWVSLESLEVLPEIVLTPESSNALRTYYPILGVSEPLTVAKIASGEK